MKRLCWIALAAVLLAAPGQAQVPDEFTNLKVFPKDIGKRELVSVMRQFAGALGVRCNHCHVGPDNLEGMDFATDELETKRVTRAMMAMTDQINSKLLPTTGRDSLMRVRCVTCHRGVARPQQLDDVLNAAVEQGGVDAALERYRELREAHYGQGSYDFSPGTLNGLAESLAQAKDLDGAIAALELNTELHPEAAYSHILLGQVRMQKGDKAGAQAALERALEIEPENGYAKRILAGIKGGG